MLYVLHIQYTTKIFKQIYKILVIYPSHHNENKPELDKFPLRDKVRFEHNLFDIITFTLPTMLNSTLEFKQMIF